MDVLEALQNLGPIAALRASMWTYPAINAAHILGLAMLFGAIMPLDLRLLGVWRSVPLVPLARVLVPIAGLGFLLAAITGALLFAVNAVDYADTRLFLAKMGLVVIGGLNAVALRASVWWQGAVAAPSAGRDSSSSDGTVPIGARISAAASLVIWISVIFCGRSLGYL